MSTIDTGLFEYLLRLGDTDLVLAQRLGEWIGHGPVLEEDIALANVGLDLLGQARLWLGYAGEVEARVHGRGRSEDELAFLRDAPAFRNLQLAEQPNGDYAATTARHMSWSGSVAGSIGRSSSSSRSAVTGSPSIACSNARTTSV